MNTLTLDRVLTAAEHLSAEERELLEGLLHQRRIEAWRKETASEAKTAIAAFRAGKFKAHSVDSVITRLRAAK